MKYLFTLIIVFSSLSSQAQTSKNSRVSPLDSVQTQIGDLSVKIVYSRPYLKGRTLGKDIVPFGKVWRTGANEATTFEVNKDISVNGNFLAAGKYSVYSILNNDETVVIFNAIWDQWGTKYDETEDVLRINVPLHHSNQIVEQFTINLDNTGCISFYWGELEFDFTLDKY